MWTPSLKQSFREELEKLVILDYIMRNTDRGLDNWMIKVDWETEQISVVSDPVHLNMDTSDPEPGPRPVDLSQRVPPRTRASYPYRTERPMDASTPVSSTPDPKISIGAIDNSLSWPWKHPDAWRSFPFGWLFLPVDLIGRPFSQKTRDHFLPLLTSTQWWSQTQLALRRIFQMDEDFQERMFARQIAVMKGQAWNVVETLKTADHGPLELTRRAKVCVWDDLVDVPVAVPMRAASAEMRRRATAESDAAAAAAAASAVAHHPRRTSDIAEEEMDIGTHASSAPAAPAVDLLGLTSPPADLPHPGRFEVALQDDAPSPPLSPERGSGSSSSNNNAARGRPQRPHYPRAHRSLNVYSPDRAPAGADQQPRYSFTRGSRSIASQLYDNTTTTTTTNPNAKNGIANGRSSSDFVSRAAAYRRNSDGLGQDLERGDGSDGDHDEDGELEGGDLGYAAATGMEGNRRKVIVERLEMVKGRNPVFTWC